MILRAAGVPLGSGVTPSALTPARVSDPGALGVAETELDATATAAVATAPARTTRIESLLAT